MASIYDVPDEELAALIGPLQQVPNADPQTAGNFLPPDFQQPGQGFLDQLAIALSQGIPQAPRGFGGSFLSGAARGFTGVRGQSIARRNEALKSAMEEAKQQNKANLEASAKVRDANAKAISDAARALAQHRLKLKEQGPQETPQERLARIEAEAAARARGSASVPSTTQGEHQQIGDDIADAIVSGDQPPDMTGLRQYTGPVRAALKKRGYDLTAASLDWKATTRWLSSANSTQQLRLRQAAQTAYESLDVVDQLSDKLRGMVPRAQAKAFNKATLTAARNGAFGVEAAVTARQLEAQITDIVSELGNVYMGGNSPTDHSLKLAEKNLSTDWSYQQLKGATDLARRNLRIRLNSIGTSGVISPSNPVQTTPVGGVNIGTRRVDYANPNGAPADTLSSEEAYQRYLKVRGGK